MALDQNLVALIDACLDDHMNISDMVNEVRIHEGISSIIIGCDTLVWALQKSKHPRALPLLVHIKSAISRYTNLKITMG